MITTTDAHQITTSRIARAARISPRTKHFVLRDKYGFACGGEGSRSSHVLAALSRSDKTPELSADVHRVAYAIYKCYNTARMNFDLARRVREDYTPYQLCGLVAKVFNANPNAGVGELVDFWINAHASEL